MEEMTYLVSDKLLTAWCWLPNPGKVWRVHEMMSGLTVDAGSKDAAVEHFTRLWNSRSRLEWRFEAPPQPRRHDGAQADKLIEHDAIPFSSLARRFHPDLNGKRKFTADQVMQIILELRDSTRPKPHHG
jgi:hypothetical protein